MVVCSVVGRFCIGHDFFAIECPSEVVLGPLESVDVEIRSRLWDNEFGSLICVFSMDVEVDLFGFVSQGLLVGIGLASRRLTARSRVAHGPAMWLGTVLALLVTIA